MLNKVACHRGWRDKGSDVLLFDQSCGNGGIPSVHRYHFSLRSERLEHDGIGARRVKQRYCKQCCGLMSARLRGDACFHLPCCEIKFPGKKSAENISMARHGSFGETR